MLYDLFISHATEDKEEFVRPLAEKLKEANVEVWYDEFSLNIGDSLRESIETGLSKSRFGLVVLSKDFFKKKWTKRELNGLLAREDESILPIWHQINKADVFQFSPILADIVALNSNKGLDHIAEKIIKKIHPQESPLVIARDELLYFGLKPPVISDEYWLDIIEASNRIPNGGAFIPREATWGRWTFPLPNHDSRGEYRGIRLAWTAMQLKWEEQAEKQKISQITHPHQVLAFIEGMPGLKEVCHEYPNILAEYAPQLTIRGFGGEFEYFFDQMLQESIKKQDKLSKEKSRCGTGLTIDKKVPLCDEIIALRHPSFGNYQSSIIVCSFVQGELMGSHVKYYETIDYLIWLLSTNSNWLPLKIKRYLIDGIKNWNTWHDFSRGYPNYEAGVAFDEAISRMREPSDFKLTPKIKKWLITLINDSAKELGGLSDTTEEILERFLAEKFIETSIKQNNEKRKKR